MSLLTYSCGQFLVPERVLIPKEKKNGIWAVAFLAEGVR
jgi:hypothetical protein